jgi:hypothetical protein
MNNFYQPGKKGKGRNGKTFTWEKGRNLYGKKGGI